MQEHKTILGTKELASPLPARKQKLKQMVLKKPGTKQGKVSKKPAQSKGPHGKTWCIMYYKAGPAYAVRVKIGPQLFPVLCRDGRDAKGICEKAVKQLLAGKAADQVKQWAKEQ